MNAPARPAPDFPQPGQPHIPAAVIGANFLPLVSSRHHICRAVLSRRLVHRSLGQAFGEGGSLWRRGKRWRRRMESGSAIFYSQRARHHSMVSSRGGARHSTNAQWPPRAPPPPRWPYFFSGVFTAPGPAEAKVENFLSSLLEPQCGHLVPLQSDERAKISLSRPHFSQ